MSAKMQYRPEIDGLRALAVIPVILFHAGFKQFSGGFIGVDVFFVISGYLITSIILKEVENRTFSFASFYERRARRILPALFLVMLSCIPFAWLWMTPLELKAFATSVVSVCLFASNVIFWKQSGYFDTSAELKPLLHTWSLAVEEQFYILFPIFLLLIWRLGRSRTVRLISVLAICSLALSEYCSRFHPSFNFYWAPTRAWELLAGSLCTFVSFSHQRIISNCLSIGGVAAILISVGIFDENTPFPSFTALLPVVGTCLVLLFGLSGTLVARILSLRPVVGMGLISYSAYLWHQPLFAFARIRSLAGPSHALLLSLCASTVLLSYFSWKFVEVPWRNKQSPFFGNRKMLVASSSMAAILFLIFGLFLGLSSC